MLRKLELRDAPFMLEWMHDESVVKDLAKDFGSMKIENCEAFIKMASEDMDKKPGEYDDIHFAISEDEDGEYLGTVSIKNIEWDDSRGEFAITIRKCAMGHGVSKQAMADVLEKAHKELGLKVIYWYVNRKNERAVRFYDKNGYSRTDVESLGIEPDIIGDVSDMIWYSDVSND